VREIEGHPRKALTMAQDQQGEKHGELHEVMTCWEEHLFFFFFLKSLPARLRATTRQEAKKSVRARKDNTL